MATCFKNSSEIHYILFIDVENDAAYFLLLLCGCGCHQHMFRSFELTSFIYLFGFSLGAKDHYSVFILSTSQYSQNSGPNFFKSVQAKKLVKSKPENLIVSTVQAKKLVNGWISFTVSESWFIFIFFYWIVCFFFWPGLFKIFRPTVLKKAFFSFLSLRSKTNYSSIYHWIGDFFFFEKKYALGVTF